MCALWPTPGANRPFFKGFSKEIKPGFRVDFSRIQSAHGVMIVALYARVSTTDQSCEMQLRELRQYAQRQSFQIFAEYVDTGFSGAAASRPQLDGYFGTPASTSSMRCWSGNWTAGGGAWRIVSAPSRNWSAWGFGSLAPPNRSTPAPRSRCPSSCYTCSRRSLRWSAKSSASASEPGYAMQKPRERAW